MKKTVVKEKVIAVEEQIMACDLCDKTLEAGSPCVAVKAGIVKSNANVHLEKLPQVICLDCLNGVRLVLDTKKIPDLRNSMTDDADDFDIAAFDKYAKFNAKYLKVRRNEI